MVLKQRHSSASATMMSPSCPPPSSSSSNNGGSGSGGISRQRHLAHLSRESSAVSLPYGSALSPTSGSGSAGAGNAGGGSSMTMTSIIGSSNNVVRRSPSVSSAAAAAGGVSSSSTSHLAQHRPSHLMMSPAPSSGVGGVGPLSPTFFGTNTPTPKNSAGGKAWKRRSFWSSFAAFAGGFFNNSSTTLQDRRLSSSPSKGPRRHHNNSNLRSTLLAVLYLTTILSCGYLTLVTSRRLSAKEARLTQMKNDYHILHHKVRETQSALQTANQINHDLEDKSKQLSRTNDNLQKELDRMVEKAKTNHGADGDGGSDALDAISPALLGKDGDDETLKGLQAEEITQLLIRRQDAMKGRIGTLQTKIQEISRREAEERFGKGPHRVEVQVDFNAGVKTAGRKDIGVFIIEMAPLTQMPHSVHLFLQMVAHKLWDDTVFLHTTHHVLQAAPIEFSTGQSKRDDFTDASLDQLSFQEYSEDYPHVKYTIGFGGRPGGPDFYISTQDNSKYHGPGGQGHHDLHEEADPCFGLVVEGHKIVDRMHRRSIATVGKDGEAWDGKDVPITSIVSMRVLDQ